MLGFAKRRLKNLKLTSIQAKLPSFFLAFFSFQVYSISFILFENLVVCVGNWAYSILILQALLQSNKVRIWNLKIIHCLVLNHSLSHTMERNSSNFILISSKSRLLIWTSIKIKKSCLYEAPLYMDGYNFYK